MLRGAIATLGLAGAVYAADKVTAPEAGPDELKSTIAAQQVAAGQLVKPASVSEHQLEAFTPDQMLELAGNYDKAMKTAAEHAENQRILAYRSRDLIRMTCIDDKLTQMTTVIKLAEPRMRSLANDLGDLLVMREHFLLASQARDRVAELATEVDLCMGDNLGTIPAGHIRGEATPETDNVFDPTRPPAPINDVERPGEASPYR
jgi:hypothetical protein